jgi:hypothetical protein
MGRFVELRYELWRLFVRKLTVGASWVLSKAESMWPAPVRTV